MNTMDQIKIRYGEEGKLVPIQEFLKAENLSGITKKIQDGLSDLYRLNSESDPPIFHFPNFPEDKHLIVDCTTPTDDDCTAHYKRGEHIVEFVRNLHDNPHLESSTFTEIIAHEFAHAEVDMPEMEKIAINGLQYNQTELINEARAFAKGKKIRRMLDGEKWYASEDERIHDIESEIAWLRTDFFYRKRWAEHFPIEENNIALASMPKEFHLPDSLLSSVSTFPKMILFSKDIDNFDLAYIREHFKETFVQMQSNRGSEMIESTAEKLLNRLLYSNQEISEENLKEDLIIMRFLLDLKNHNGESIWGESRLFSGNTSKLLGLVEHLTDSNGKQIFPGAEKIKKMSASEFSTYLDHYLGKKNEDDEWIDEKSQGTGVIIEVNDAQDDWDWKEEDFEPSEISFKQKNNEKKDSVAHSDTLKKVLGDGTKEGKKAALKEFHTQQSPVGVKRRTALKFDR